MSDGALEASEVADLLASLTEKSLVVYDATTGRCSLLWMVREYAREALAAEGEAGAVRRRHRESFLRMAEEAAEALQGPGQADWLRRLDQDHDNLVAALEHCAGSADGAEPGLRIACSLWRYWEVRGLFAEGVRRVEEFLARPESAGDAALRARALNILGNLRFRRGEYAQAQAAYVESLEIRHRLGDQHGIARLLSNLGAVHNDLGDFTTAEALLTDAAAAARSLGDRAGEAGDLHNLGLALYRQRRFSEAAQRFLEADQILRELGGGATHLYVLQMLGALELESGRVDAAEARFREMLAAARDLGARHPVLYGLYGMAHVALRQGAPERAALLHGAAAALHAALESPMDPAQSREVEAALAALREELGGARFEAAWSHGRQLGFHEALDIALEERRELPSRAGAGSNPSNGGCGVPGPLPYWCRFP